MFKLVGQNVYSSLQVALKENVTPKPLDVTTTANIFQALTDRWTIHSKEVFSLFHYQLSAKANAVGSSANFALLKPLLIRHKLLGPNYYTIAHFIV